MAEPKITDPVPEHLAPQIAAMQAGLDEALPQKVLDHNLVIGSWNIRAFGDFQRDWEGDPDRSPKRDMFSLVAIAEVLRRFDVVAMQEVRDNLACLRHVLKYLRHHGDHWGLLLTDVTKGDAGNKERLAFLYDTRKVRPSGLACELVLPPQAGEPSKQFARTPYAASFTCGGQTFILVTVHILYGDDEEDREPELRAMAQWLREWAKDEHGWDHNIIILGDFNIDRVGDPRYQAFTRTGLRTHPAHATLPATVFHDPAEPEKFKHYDQVAWFTGPDIEPLSLGVGGGGHFDPHAYVLGDVATGTASWMLSDHYPLWVEFFTGDTRPADAATLRQPQGLSVKIPAVLFEAPAGAPTNAEWVEIENQGSDAVDLSGWTLQDEAGNTFTFPAGHVLGAGESLKVHTGPGTDSRSALHWGRSRGVWNDTGDVAVLRDAAGAEIARNGG